MSSICPCFVKFFEPKSKFLRWLKNYCRDQFVIEIGSGTCEFTLKMRDMGIKAMAIEPRANDEVLSKCFNFLYPNVFQNCGILSSTPAIVIVARPDHGGWFETIPDYMHEESELLYIGLRKNVLLDLGYHEFEHLYEDAGEEGEVVLRIIR